MRSPGGDVIAKWIARGAVDPEAEWERIPGGNTNETWRVGDRAVKRYRAGGETPIFGNDALSERHAMIALTGSGLAPELIDADDDTVVYGWVEGHGWTPEDGVEPVARALADLHGRELPHGLSEIDLCVETLARQTRRMGGSVPEVPSRLPAQTRVFLHGDATAANVMVGPQGVTLIDWQCPARGDAASDLAVFLSPSMQALAGNRPLSRAEVEAFLDAYDNRAVTDRYRALAPLYAARMGAYCRWRAARGDAGYARAALLETA